MTLKLEIKAATILGVPVYIDWTILLLFAVLLGAGPQGLAVGVILLLSITVHEFAHVLWARRYGFQTERITLHFFGGAASIECINDIAPRKEFLISLAGPLSSLAIAMVGLVLLKVSSIITPETVWLLELLVTTVSINTLIFVFNLSPIFPLDGGRMLRSVLKSRMGHERGTKLALNIGPVASLGLIGISIAWIPSMLIISILLLIVGLVIRWSFNKESSTPKGAGLKN